MANDETTASPECSSSKPEGEKEKSDNGEKIAAAE